MVPSPGASVQTGELTGRRLRCEAVTGPAGGGQVHPTFAAALPPSSAPPLGGVGGLSREKPGVTALSGLPGPEGPVWLHQLTCPPGAGSPGEETGGWPPGRPPQPGGVSELLGSQVGRGEKGSPGATVTWL